MNRNRCTNKKDRKEKERQIEIIGIRHIERERNSKKGARDRWIDRWINRQMLIYGKRQTNRQ
jgi:hypothetical protein